MLTPTLHVVTSGLPSITTGAFNAAVIRDAVSFTCSAPLHGAKNDDEFVATHAHDDVVSADCIFDALSDRLQQLVAGLMAMRVVDVLEAVEIQEQHRESQLGSSRLFHRDRQMRAQKQSIRQACQLIVMRESIESLLVFEQLRFDLAPDSTAMFGLLQKFAMTFLGLYRTVAQLANLLSKLDSPDGNAEQRE